MTPQIDMAQSDTPTTKLLRDENAFRTTVLKRMGLNTKKDCSFDLLNYSCLIFDYNAMQYKEK